MKQEIYVGLTGNTFKTRYLNHINSFRNSKLKLVTELNIYIWSLKDSNIQHSVKWRIIKQCKSYSKSTKRCNLCLHEKFIIICHPELSSLNKRNELVSTCRQKKNTCCVISNFRLNIITPNTRTNITPKPLIIL